MTTAKKTSLAIAAAALGSVLATGVSIAQTPAPTSAPAAAELSLGQVVAKLESLGYTAIGDAERDDGVWEVEAVSPSGARVEVELDPRDGRVLRERADRD